MSELYNANFFNSTLNKPMSVKKIESVISIKEIIALARHCGVIERSRIFDIVAFVCALVDFNDRGMLSSAKYTINNFRLNYYSKYAKEHISDKAFHNQLRKPEIVEFLEKLILRIYSYIGNDNPCSEHLELVKILSSVGITDVVPVDGSGFFVRLSCRKNFNCKTAGRKSTQRGVQKENAGIKVHMAFSNVNGTISHLSITEGTGSEREQVRADEYEEGMLNIKDRGYIDYNGEPLYANRSQFHLTRYRTNVQGTVIMAVDGETGESLDELIGKAPSCEIPDNIKSEYIDMLVKRISDSGNEVIARVVRVRNPDGEFSYYGTNLPMDKIPAKAVYLLYRCRWEGSELTFKALQSGDGMRTINSSLLDVIITFMLGNILTYSFKQLVATVAKRIAKSEVSFSILRIHTVLEATDALIKSFTNGVRSSIYRAIHKQLDRILESCTRKEASLRDKQTFKDLPTVVKTIDDLVNG